MVEKKMVVRASMQRMFEIIRDYERYPEFLPELASVEVLSRDGNVAVARFEIEMMMRVVYTLRLSETEPDGVTWTLEEARLLANNSGQWNLKAIDDTTTEVTYGVDLAFRGMIPESVSDRLQAIVLPQTLERFKARAEALEAS